MSRHFRDWVIETWDHDPKARTGRWVMWRHRHGDKPVADFDTFGALKRFAKHHAIGVGTGLKVRAYNRKTREEKQIVL